MIIFSIFLVNDADIIFPYGGFITMIIFWFCCCTLLFVCNNGWSGYWFFCDIDIINYTSMFCIWFCYLYCNIITIGCIQYKSIIMDVIFLSLNFFYYNVWYNFPILFYHIILYYHMVHDLYAIVPVVIQIL